MAEYINTFHNPLNRDSKQVFNCDSRPVKYEGYLIYPRIKGSVFDVVKDGKCIGMYAGLGGAKSFINILKINSRLFG